MDNHVLLKEKNHPHFRQCMSILLASAGTLIHPQFVSFGGISHLNSLNWLPGFLGFFAFLSITICSNRRLNRALRWSVQLGGIVGIAAIPYLWSSENIWEVPTVLTILSLFAQMIAVIALTLWVLQLPQSVLAGGSIVWKISCSIYILCDVLIVGEEIRRALTAAGEEWMLLTFFSTLQTLFLLLRLCLGVGMFISIVRLVLRHTAWVASKT